MTRCVVSALALMVVSVLGCKRGPVHSVDLRAPEPSADPVVGDAHARNPTAGTAGTAGPPEAQDPNGLDDANALPAWAATKPPEDDVSEDLDGDGSLERITLWCTTDDEEDGDDEIIIVVGTVREHFLPSLSDMMGCGMEVAGPAGGAKQLWVMAYEHDEVGPGTFYLLAFEGGRLHLVWEETSDVSIHGDGTWMTSESICWEDEGKETTYSTEYRVVAGTIESTDSEESTPVDPGDCETFDP